MHVFLLFGWPQKMHTSLICRNRGMYFTKRWKYALPHGKMHIFGKSWSHQKCILKNACCPKMQIENAYFLRAIFTAIQKCIMDSGTPTFLICTVSPKVLWWFFYTCFSLCHLNVTQPVWQEISSTHFGVSTWARCSIFWKIKRKWISMVSVVSRLRGFWLGSCDHCGQRQLGMAGVQDAIASFGGIFTRRWTRIVYTMPCLKASSLNVFFCAKRFRSILWLAFPGYYGCAVGGCLRWPKASRVSKNWTPCGKFWHMHFWHLQPVSMHLYYAFLSKDFAFGIHGLLPGQQLISISRCARSCNSLLERIPPGSPQDLDKIMQGPLTQGFTGKMPCPDGPRDPDPHFVRACAAEMHIDMSQELSHARIYRENAAPQMLRPHALCASLPVQSKYTRGPSYTRILGQNAVPRWTPRPRPTLCTSLRSRNAHGHVTGAISRENLQGKCRAPDVETARTLREPACAVEMHTRAILYENSGQNAVPRWTPRPRPALCASLRSRNAHGHVTGAISRQNLPGKCRAPDVETARTLREPACAVKMHTRAILYENSGAKCRAQMDPGTATRTLCEPAQRNAHGHVTGAISRENLPGKCRAPDVETARTLREPACTVEMHTRAILYENSGTKCRAPDGSRDRGPHFARACAVEMHIDIP